MPEPIPLSAGLERNLGPLTEFSRARFEVRRVLERKGVVVVLFRATLRGRTSGLDMMEDAAFLFRLRGGRVTRFSLYRDPREALADAGLDAAT